MNDGRGSGVQEVKAFEDLSAPRTQNLDFHDLETLQVAAGEITRKRMCHSKKHPRIIFQWPLSDTITSLNR